MRAKLKVFPMLQSKAQGVSTAAHAKEAAGEKFSSLVCASHEICDSSVELSCGGSEWDLSCFWAVPALKILPCVMQTPPGTSPQLDPQLNEMPVGNNNSQLHRSLSRIL